MFQLIHDTLLLISIYTNNTLKYVKNISTNISCKINYILLPKNIKQLIKLSRKIK